MGIQVKRTDSDVYRRSPHCKSKSIYNGHRERSTFISPTYMAGRPSLRLKITVNLFIMATEREVRLFHQITWRRDPR